MKTDNINVCLVPFQITWEDKQLNLDNLKSLLSDVHQDTDLIVIPETFSTGFPIGKNKDEIRLISERNTGETIDFIKNLSKSLNMAICGSFVADTGGSLFNRAFFIEPSGEEYFADKRHLFKPGGEDKIFSAGHKRMLVRYRGWNISMIVCYDLRFPVWCRNRNNEYDILIAVANWPVSRIKVWDALLQARALENQAYVVGVNCKGIDTNNTSYNGSSAVFSPTGKNITVSMPSNPDMLYASLSKEKLDEFRNKFPVWKDADNFEIL